jgi:phosphatidylglycerol phospholipase C
MGVAVILTDVPKVWLGLRAELEADYASVDRRHSRMFRWSQLKFYTIYHKVISSALEKRLVSAGGSFEAVSNAVKVA